MPWQVVVSSVLALVVGACREAPPEPGPVAPRVVQEPAWLGRAAVTSVVDATLLPGPELPATFAEFVQHRDAHDLPSMDATNVLLCAGDRAQWQRLMKLAHEAPAMNYSASAALSGYGRGCGATRHCAVALELHRAEASEDVRYLLGRTLLDCADALPPGGPDVVPDEVRFSAVLAARTGSLFPPVMRPDFARATLRLWTGGGQGEVLDALGTLSRMRGPETPGLLLALHAKAPKRGRLAIEEALGLVDAPVARGLFAKACPEKRRDDEACRHGWLHRDTTPLASLLVGGTVDLEDVLATRDGPELPEALAACVRAEDGLLQARCLLALGERDFMRAAALVREGVALQSDVAREAGAFVTSAPTPEEARRKLGVGEVRSPVVLPRSLLALAGRGLFVDLRNSVGDVALLVTLAALDGSPLRDVRFRAHVVHDGETQTLGVDAFLDGRRVSMQHESGRWIAPYVFTTFLNALAASRGSNYRWVPLAADGQDTVILGSEANALEAGVRAGVFVPASIEGLAETTREADRYRKAILGGE